MGKKKKTLPPSPTDTIKRNARAHRPHTPATHQIRFAIENEFDEVDVIYISESEVRCVTPRRNGPGTAHVTASNDGQQFSGFPLVYTKGSGTFLKFIFDNSEPGCLDCINSMDGDGLNPLNVVEKWFVDNATGPYIGGTQVTITAKGLDFARANINAPYDLFLAGTGGESSLFSFC